jgi:hypothetical protein
VELESIERILMQTELTVMAGDQESYSISAKGNNQMSVMLQALLTAGLD